jgi:hypothetical protein
VKNQKGSLIFKGKAWDYEAGNSRIAVIGPAVLGEHRTFICDRITEDAVADVKRALCSRFGGHEFAMVYNDGYGCLNCGCLKAVKGGDL